MYKLSFSKPSYSTFKEGKITVCEYECILSAGTDVVEKFKAVGKAMCSDNDTLDDIKGRSIAEARAKFGAYDKAFSLGGSSRDIDMLTHMIPVLQAKLKALKKFRKLRNKQNKTIHALTK